MDGLDAEQLRQLSDSDLIQKIVDLLEEIKEEAEYYEFTGWAYLLEEAAHNIASEKWKEEKDWKLILKELERVEGIIDEWAAPLGRNIQEFGQQSGEIPVSLLAEHSLVGTWKKEIVAYKQEVKRRRQGINAPKLLGRTLRLLWNMGGFAQVHGRNDIGKLAVQVRELILEESGRSTQIEEIDSGKVIRELEKVEAALGEWLSTVDMEEDEWLYLDIENALNEIRSCKEDWEVWHEVKTNQPDMRKAQPVELQKQAQATPKTIQDALILLEEVRRAAQRYKMKKVEELAENASQIIASEMGKPDLNWNRVIRELGKIEDALSSWLAAWEESIQRLQQFLGGRPPGLARDYDIVNNLRNRVASLKGEMEGREQEPGEAEQQAQAPAQTTPPTGTPTGLPRLDDILNAATAFKDLIDTVNNFADRWVGVTAKLEGEKKGAAYVDFFFSDYYRQARGTIENLIARIEEYRRKHAIHISPYQPNRAEAYLKEIHNHLLEITKKWDSQLALEGGHIARRTPEDRRGGILGDTSLEMYLRFKVSDIYDKLHSIPDEDIKRAAVTLQLAEQGHQEIRAEIGRLWAAEQRGLGIMEVLGIVGRELAGLPSPRERDETSVSARQYLREKFSRIGEQRINLLAGMGRGKGELPGAFRALPPKQRERLISSLEASPEGEKYYDLHDLLVSLHWSLVNLHRFLSALPPGFTGEGQPISIDSFDPTKYKNIPTELRDAMLGWKSVGTTLKEALDNYVKIYRQPRQDIEADIKRLKKENIPSLLAEFITVTKRLAREYAKVPDSVKKNIPKVEEYLLRADGLLLLETLLNALQSQLARQVSKSAQPLLQVLQTLDVLKHQPSQVIEKQTL